MTIPTSLQFVPAEGDDVPLWPSLVPVQALPPASSARVWVDTSSTAAVLRVWDGDSWEAGGGVGGGVGSADLGNLTGAVTLTSTGQDVKAGRLVGNVTITPPAGTHLGDTLTLLLTQDDTGGRTVTWSGFKWANATAPTMSPDAGDTDVYTFLCSGLDWLGFVSGQNFTTTPPPPLTPVTPTAPTFTDLVGTASDTYTIPTTAGVTYKVAGATKAAGTYAGTGTVTVTAEATAGYTLSGTSTWSHVFSTASPAIVDTFTAADGTALAGRTTPTGGVAWGSPYGASGAGQTSATITENRVASNNPSGGMSASLVAGSANVLASIDYDLTGTGSGSQVRLAVRGTGTGFTPGDYGVIAIVKGNGAVSGETVGEAAIGAFAGSGAPQTGTLSLEVTSANVCTLRINGTQVGSSFTTALTGSRVGFSTYGLASAVDNFTVTYL